MFDALKKLQHFSLTQELDLKFGEDFEAQEGKGSCGPGWCSASLKVLKQFEGFVAS